jgi:hypothetical protein
MDDREILKEIKQKIDEIYEQQDSMYDNISRITRNIEKLCEHFGLKPVKYGQ